MICIESADISIHPPRAGRDRQVFFQVSKQNISIHPPRAGRDFIGRLLTDGYAEISIHPPRAGRDNDGAGRNYVAPYFNPPSPCGEGLFQTLTR